MQLQKNPEKFRSLDRVVTGVGGKPCENLQNFCRIFFYFKFEVADNRTLLLGYNEPNRPDQVNCPPKETARYYKELNERYPEREDVLAVLDKIKDRVQVSQWIGTDSKATSSVIKQYLFDIVQKSMFCQ